MEALNWAWSVDCTSTQKLVLLALADRADKEAVCWPSVKQTALRCSLSRKATQLALKALSKRGVIYWHDFTDDLNRTRHRFTLNLRTTFAREQDSPVNDVRPTREHDTHPPANDVPPPCEPRSHTPRKTFAQTQREPTGNPNLESKDESTHPPSPPQGGSGGVAEHEEVGFNLINAIRKAAGPDAPQRSVSRWFGAIAKQRGSQTYPGKVKTFASRVLTELTAIGADLSVEPKVITVPGQLATSNRLSWHECADDFIGQHLGLKSMARRLAIGWSASLHRRANLSTHDTWQDDLKAFVKIKGHAERSE